MTIGLIGGVGWPSTMDYYRLLNEAVNRDRGGAHSADLVLRSLDFQTLLDRLDRPAEIEARLDAAAGDLAAAGATVLGIAAVTGHRFAAPLERRTDLRFVHLGDVTSRALAHHGVRRPGVLATSRTLSDPGLLERMTRGTEPVLPAESRRAELDEVIFGDLIRGRHGEDVRRVLSATADRLRADGADALLLACTELAAVRDHLGTALPIHDATSLHCQALLEEARGASPSRYACPGPT